MKTYLTFLFLIGFFTANAQIEDQQKRSISDDNFNTAESRLLRESNQSFSSGNFNLMKPEKEKNSYLQKKEEKKFSMKPQKVFVARKVEFKPEYAGNKPERKVKEEFGEDINYGEYVNNGKYVRIVCRDFQAVDGDKVRLLVNGKTYVGQIYLTGQAKGIRVNLKKGFNKIAFQALNQGASGPNTAAFQVYDDQGNLIMSDAWNLTTGTTASLLIIKNK